MHTKLPAKKLQLLNGLLLIMPTRDLQLEDVVEIQMILSSPKQKLKRRCTFKIC
jgi:hypothetical protein